MTLLSCSDMFLQRTNKLGGHYLKKIKSRAAVAVLRLVQSEEDRAELVSRLDLMADGERQATAVIITQEVALENLINCLKPSYNTLITLEIQSWSQFSHSSDSRHVHLHGGEQSELHQGQHPHPSPDGGHLLRSEGRHSSKLCDIGRSTWTRGDSRYKITIITIKIWFY